MRQHQCISFYDTEVQGVTVNGLENNDTKLTPKAEADKTALTPKKQPWYAWILTAAIVAVSTQG